jgi:glyoxylase-like metal-dependent hydrolase (beta-lactamase superfamily II)
MGIKLDMIRSGVTNTYVVCDQGTVLVDPGMAASAQRLLDLGV